MNQRSSEANTFGGNQVERGPQLSNKASFALRSILSPVHKSYKSIGPYDQNFEGNSMQGIHIQTEPDSPSHRQNAFRKGSNNSMIDNNFSVPSQGQLYGNIANNIVTSPKRINMLQPQGSMSSPFNPNGYPSPEKIPMFNASSMFDPNRNNERKGPSQPFRFMNYNDQASQQRGDSPQRSHVSGIFDFSEDNKIRDYPPRLPQPILSPIISNKSVNYQEPNFNTRTRAVTLSDSIDGHSPSHMLQNNARQILKPDGGNMNFSEALSMQDPSLSPPRQRFQSFGEPYSGSISPKKSITINNAQDVLSLRQLGSMSPERDGTSVKNRIALPQIFHEPKNEIELLRYRINPPPPAEPDPFADKRAVFAQPLSKLFGIGNKSPQKPNDVKPGVVAHAERNAQAFKKAKGIKNVMQREGQRDPKLRLNHRIRYRLNTLLWLVVYPVLLRNKIVKITKEKMSKVNYKARQIVKEHINHIAKFIKERCLTTLEIIYTETRPLNFVSKKSKPTKSKELTDKKLEKAKNVSALLITLLQGLVIETSNEDLPNPLLEYLASISEDSYYVPSGFLFEFEICRLEFTQFLALKNMNPERSKMIIGMFFLVRMLVFYFLTQPWAAKIKIRQTPLLLEKRLPILNRNQDSTPEDKRLKPRDGPLVVFGDQPKLEGEPDKQDVILGLYNKEALAGYFISQEHPVTKMKSLIEEWLEEIYSRVHLVYIENLKDKKDDVVKQ